MHSCWFDLDFAVSIRQEIGENSEVFQSLQFLSRDNVQEGSINRVLWVEQIGSDANHSARVARGEELIGVFFIFRCNDFNFSASKHGIVFPLFLVVVY